MPVLLFGEQGEGEALAAHAERYGPVPDGRDVLFVHVVGLEARTG